MGVENTAIQSLFQKAGIYNLGFMTCKTDDLKLDTNGKDFLKASLGRIKLT